VAHSKLTDDARIVHAGDERWLPVPGYEGSYEVSDFGNVRSVPRVRNCRNGTRLAPGCDLKPFPDQSGYPWVRLSLPDKSVARRVHTLVLAAFVGPRPAGMVIRHLNGIESDNRLENLRYGTHSENSKDIVLHGRNRASNKTHCNHGHELTVENCCPTQLAKGKRECIQCRKNRSREYRLRMKNAPTNPC
jgi:hypothetical protein